MNAQLLLNLFTSHSHSLRVRVEKTMQNSNWNIIRTFQRQFLHNSSIIHKFQLTHHARPDWAKEGGEKWSFNNLVHFFFAFSNWFKCLAYPAGQYWAIDFHLINYLLPMPALKIFGRLEREKGLHKLFVLIITLHSGTKRNIRWLFQMYPMCESEYNVAKCKTISSADAHITQ